MSIYLHLPYVAMLQQKTRPSHSSLWTPWITSSVTVARNSSAHARSQGTKFRGRNLKHFKISVGHSRIGTGGGGGGGTDSQVCKQTSGDDPRTGTFYQTRLEDWDGGAQVCKQTSGGDPRTGTFYQMRTTAGYIPPVVRMGYNMLS